MSRKQSIILAVIVALAGFIAWLALSNRQPPLLPADETHQAFESAAACLSCHGPEGPAPQSSRHPLGDDCTRCHGRR